MTPDERAEELHDDIDAVAREFDHYEYGLPYSDEPKAKIVALIAAAIRKLASGGRADRAAGEGE